MYRSSDRVLGGVLAGFADFINYDPTIVRILYVALSVVSAAFPGILLYLVLWVITPEKPNA